MSRRPFRSVVLTLAVLAVQVGVSALATISMCIERPHTHGGRLALDCLMHHQPEGTPGQPVAHAHHQHGSSAPIDDAQITCSCASDPLSFMTTEPAVLQPSQGIGQSLLVELSLPDRWRSVPDQRPAPLSPPPRLPRF